MFGHYKAGNISASLFLMSQIKVTICTLIISGERCLADLFHKYLTALGNTGRFCRRPLAGGVIKYGNQVVGINKLKNMIKVICERAGLKGNFTNHSGKRTCATQLYIAGVDEQEIMLRTGNRSEKSVRKYKQSCPEIQNKVAVILDPPQPDYSKCAVSDNSRRTVKILFQIRFQCWIILNRTVHATELSIRNLNLSVKVQL